MQESKDTQRLEAALQYAKLGWAILPVHGVTKEGGCGCGNDTCSSPGKHPLEVLVRHGVHDASADPAKLREWWYTHPQANIGVATGKRSGFFALDVDLPDGEDSLRRLEEQNGPLPATVEQITGKGGRHLLFKLPAGAEIKNSASKLGHNLDIRGEGGYIVVAPSHHASGKAYAWKPGQGPGELAMAEAPSWLVDLLNDKPALPRSVPAAITVGMTTAYGRAALQGELETLVRVAEGQRNDSLNRSAFRVGQLVAGGEIEQGEAEKALIDMGDQMGLARTEVRKTVNSGLEKGMKQPRAPKEAGEITTVADKPEPPRPLTREMPPGEDYPVKVLGTLLGGAVQAIADTVQVPTALAAGSVLAVASLATQGLADVVIPIGEGRARPLSLYLVTVAESSARKTTADSFALQAVRDFEAQLEVDFRGHYAKYQCLKAAYDHAKDRILKKAPKGETQNDVTVSATAEAIAALGAEPRPPMLPTVIVQDLTIEGLAKLFQLGRPSMGLFTTEGAQVIGGYSLRAEHKIASAAWLSLLWDGETLKRTRMGDGNYALPGRRLTMHWMVQPEVACHLLADPDLNGQGWISRILPAAPPPLAGTRFYREMDPANMIALTAFEVRMRALLATPLPLTERSEEGLKPRGLYLSPAAKQRWIAFADEMETGIGAGGLFEPVKAFAGKLAEQAARLAGILMLVDDLEAIEVAEGAMVAACRVMRFYASEALRIHHAGMTSPELREAQILLDWLHRREGELVSLPEIYQLGPNSIREQAKARQMMKTLADHGWVIPQSEGAEIKGHHYREVWRIIREKKQK
ncbi:MAG: DUF3987 domain-containing protein [Desulfobacteraceae bacterium]|nr:MAG: DUF3987 domain-containing protein [Desulfobacteraceae bacterium]